MTEIASPARFYGGLAGESFGGVGGAPLILLHGLTFNRRQWAPLVEALQAAGSRRRVLALDLPGHGDSPAAESYHATDVVEAVHRAAAEAGLTGSGQAAPVVVGHSIGAVFATAYAAAYPVEAVVNIDQPLRAEGFARMLRGMESVLRGPDFGSVWESLVVGMGVEELPPAARDLVRTGTTPRQDLLLGYWDELLTLPYGEIERRRTHELDTVRTKGVAYHHVSGYDLDPAYSAWLQAALPDAAITVLPGGDTSRTWPTRSSSPKSSTSGGREPWRRPAASLKRVIVTRRARRAGRRNGEIPGAVPPPRRLAPTPPGNRSSAG